VGAAPAEHDLSERIVGVLTHCTSVTLSGGWRGGVSAPARDTLRHRDTYRCASVSLVRTSSPEGIMSTRSADRARRAAMRRAGRDPLPALMLRQRAPDGLDKAPSASGYSVFVAVLAIGIGCWALGCIYVGVFSGPPRLIGIGAALGVGAVAEWRLARELHHFSRWGWYGVMMELAFAFAVSVWAILRIGILAWWGPLVVVPWMLHFWQNRRHYDIGDVPG
jgi:hypothetical protein